MQASQIINIAIVFIPVAYVLYIAVQFASGLAKLGKRPVASISEPQESATEHAAEVTPVVDPWSLPCTAVDAPAESIAEVTPLIPATAPIALLPAFIPAVQIEATADDHALVEGAWMRLYCNAGLDDVVVPFTRPLSATQKPQQQHPAIEGMTLRAMRELGTTLKIKGSRRWNTQQAIDALTHHYQQAA